MWRHSTLRPLKMAPFLWLYHWYLYENITYIADIFKTCAISVWTEILILNDHVTNYKSTIHLTSKLRHEFYLHSYSHTLHSLNQTMSIDVHSLKGLNWIGFTASCAISTATDVHCVICQSIYCVPFMVVEQFNGPSFVIILLLQFVF